jgi:two-component sensor histidine kinase
LDHRTLNLLAVVAGIVRLSRADDAAGYAAAVQRRIDALVRAHTVLAQHGWRAAPLDDLIRIQVEPYGLERIALKGLAVEIAAQDVQPLALVIHEMISNAAVHGALSGPRGTVAVEWKASDTHVMLDWTETGGPVPPRARTPGLGSTIIEGTLERQLQGAVQRTWNSDGLQAQLRFGLRAVAAGRT